MLTGWRGLLYPYKYVTDRVLCLKGGARGYTTPSDLAGWYHPREMSYEQVFRFGSADWVLFGNALNEVLHGFNVPDFDEVIGSD
jgi:hypothetical protein